MKYLLILLISPVYMFACDDCLQKFNSLKKELCKNIVEGDIETKYSSQPDQYYFWTGALHGIEYAINVMETNHLSN